MPVNITYFFAYKIGRVMIESKEIKSTFKNKICNENELNLCFHFFIWNINTGDDFVNTAVIFVILHVGYNMRYNIYLYSVESPLG